MAGGTARERIVVLRKTKLRETDLIVTFLASDGSLGRAVAKGARKPQSPFAARLELYAVSDVLIARGRSLDIVKEARLVAAHGGLHANLERASCAAPVAELLSRTAQEGLPVERLFDLTCASFDALERVPAASAPAAAAAALLKALAFSGFRPVLGRCALCGAEVPLVAGSLAAFSVAEGGTVCGRCRPQAECRLLPAEGLSFARTLLTSTFAAIETLPPDLDAAFSALRLVQQLAREHAGVNLKSLNFLFTCGLFG